MTGTFNLCELHGKCLDEDWRDDVGESHAGCLTEPSPEVLASFQRMRERAHHREHARRVLDGIEDAERAERSREEGVDTP